MLFDSICTFCPALIITHLVCEKNNVDTLRIIKIGGCIAEIFFGGYKHSLKNNQIGGYKALLKSLEDMRKSSFHRIGGYKTSQSKLEDMSKI